MDKECYRNIIKDITEATCRELVWELLSRPWRRIIRFFIRCWLWSRGRPIDHFPEKRSVSSSESLIQEHEKQLLELNEENQQLKKALDQVQDDYNRLRGQAQLLERQMDTMISSYERKIEEMQHEHSVGIATLRSEKDEMKRAKEDALSRLSDLMGSKLRDNNPAITDLNDPNRPMKLGDQFSQIYENDWTDAFIALTDQRNDDESTKYDEESAIALLLRLIMEIDEKCAETSRIQLSGVIKSTENFSRDEVSDYIKAAKDSHKTNALKYLPLIMQELTGEKSACETVVKYLHLQECRSFIDSCIKFCYLAAVQDPPMYLSFETRKDFDRQVFKEYTASGSKVKFLVWPALFLHRSGPLLSKGVVQPMENPHIVEPEGKPLDVQSIDFSLKTKEHKSDFESLDVWSFENSSNDGSVESTPGDAPTEKAEKADGSTNIVSDTGSTENSIDVRSTENAPDSRST